MNNVTFYHRDTGVLHPLTIVTNDEKAVALNTPPDHLAINQPEDDRCLDHRSQKIDLEKLEAERRAHLESHADSKSPPPFTPSPAVVVSYEAPLSPDAAWSETLRAARSRGARQAELVNQQHSLVRRLTLDPSDESARTALAAIDTEISELPKE